MNRARALKCRRARKVQTVRHQHPKHQHKRKREEEQEDFSLMNHLTYLANVVQYYENSPNEKSDTEKRPKEVWQGACPDTGAQKTVIGDRQAEHTASTLGVNSKSSLLGRYSDLA